MAGIIIRDGVTIEVDDRMVRAMLGQYGPSEMHNRLRRGTRAGGAVYRTALRAAARSRAEIPDTFARTRTKSSSRLGGDIYTRVRPRSPLFNIFEAGARPHEIAPGQRTGGPSKKGRSRRLTGKLLLSGRAGKRWRKSDFVASMPVLHPGMAPRPLVAPVFTTTTPAAARAVVGAVFGGQQMTLFGLAEAGG